jgi:hypothetical protein
MERTKLTDELLEVWQAARGLVVLREYHNAGYEKFKNFSAAEINKLMESLGYTYRNGDWWS